MKASESNNLMSVKRSRKCQEDLDLIKSILSIALKKRNKIMTQRKQRDRKIDHG